MHIFRRKQLFKRSKKVNIAMEGLDSFRKYWGSVLSADKKELVTSFASSEDVMYAEYRDELDDFVTIEN